MLTRRNAVTGALAAAGAGLPLRPLAQTVAKPAQMIVGFAAGGGTDVSARIFAERLRGDYAASVVVENKVGAAGRMAVEYVKNAPPDGSAMLFTSDFPVTLYPHIFKKLNYDSLRDLIAVAPLTKSSLVISIGPLVPKDIVTLKGFLEWAKANPDKASFATTGAGGTPHFAGVMLSKESKVPLTAVHYRGGGPALQDLIGGHIAASVNPSSEALPLAQAGQLRMLGAANSQRSRFLPDVPTLREQGLDIAFDTWTGVFVTAGTPANIVAALSAALEKATKAADLIEAQAKLGNEIFFQSPGDFAVTVRASIERWGPIVAASGFVPED